MLSGVYAPDNFFIRMPLPIKDIRLSLYYMNILKNKGVICGVALVCAMMLGMAGCNRAVLFDRELSRAESLLDVRADSALKILNGINVDEPRHAGRKARLALLLTLAHEKCGMNVPDDSLVSLFADYYMENGTNREKFLSYYYAGMVNEHNGDYQRALLMYSRAEQLYEYTDGTLSAVLRSRLDSLDVYLTTSKPASQREFIAGELERYVADEKSARDSMAMWIVFAVVVACAVIVYLREQLTGKEKRLEYYADVIAELKDRADDNTTAMRELNEALFKDYFKTLNSVGATFFDKENDSFGHKTVYREVKEMIERFKQKKTRREVEDLVNRCRNDVMVKLRNEIPDLQEDDYTQLCFHFAGFSSKLISLITDNALTNVNTRKFRLKKRIEQSGACHKDEILGCF